MAILSTLLNLTNFQTALLSTVAPTTLLAYTLQFAAAAPSISIESERYYDLSGSITHLSCTALSLGLPFLRAVAAGQCAGGLVGLKQYLSAPRPGQSFWWWRQAALSACVGVWGARLGTHLYTRINQNQHKDSRFNEIRHSPSKFALAFFGQATWITLTQLPVFALNALPRSSFAQTRIHHVTSKLPVPLSVRPYWTDILGFSLFIFGFLFEVVADRQKGKWDRERREKKHDEKFMKSGLWGKSRHPNYLGEITLWTGVAVVAAGVLMRAPAMRALGLGGGTGRAVVGVLCAISPIFTAFLLLEVSGVPLSEAKYDKKFGNREDYRVWKETTPMILPKLW